MNRRTFYREWGKRAFGGKLFKAEGWSGVLTLVALVIAYVWKPMGGALDILPLAVFGAVFAGTVFVGLIVAPYHMLKEREVVGQGSNQSSPSQIFIIENLESQGFNSTTSTLTIPVGITVTPTMLVEGIQLRLLDMSISSDWWQRRIGGSAERHLANFVIPEQVKSGGYTVHLVAFADGISTESKPFRITIPDR